MADQWKLMQTHLTIEELEIECRVRNIPLSQFGSDIAIQDILEKESKKIIEPPKASHVTDNPDSEINLFSYTIDELNMSVKKISENTRPEEILPLLVRTCHYVDRAERLKNSFRTDKNFNTLITSLRRLKQTMANWYEMSTMKFQTTIFKPPVSTMKTSNSNGSEPITTTNAARTDDMTLSDKTNFPTTTIAIENKNGTATANLGNVQNSIRISTNNGLDPNSSMSSSKGLPIFSYNNFDETMRARMVNGQTHNNLIYTTSSNLGPTQHSFDQQSHFNMVGNHPVHDINSIWTPLSKQANDNLHTNASAQANAMNQQRNHAALENLVNDRFVPPIHHDERLGFRPQNELIHVQGQQEQRPRYYKPPRWGLAFDGESDPRMYKSRHDIHIIHDVQDFIFRLEMYATRDAYPVHGLSSIIMNFVTGTAENWLWVFIRKNPGATWNAIKNAMLARFCSEDFEESTIHSIYHKLQGPKESINHYIMEIEALNNRLTNPLPEIQLMRTIRHNMSTELQDKTLHLRFNSIEELRSMCASYENLWAKHSHRSHTNNSNVSLPRRPPTIHEISTNNSEINNLHEGVNQMSIGINENEEASPISSVSALTRSNGNQNSKPISLAYTMCHNCKDMGHYFKDCPKEVSKEFCFGCRPTEIRLPFCSDCSKLIDLNKLPNVMASVAQRSDAAPTTHRQPF